ncbi:conjugal transfer protein TraC, partial [Patescibacteria group bacterium]
MFGINGKNDQGEADAIVESEKLYQRGLATIKDLIAPSAMKVGVSYVQIGEIYARTLFVIAYPRFLHTNWFSPIINLDSPLDVAMFVHPVDTTEILKTLRKSATQVQSQINIEFEAGKIRDPILETALNDIEELRDKLQQGIEKFFRFGLYITFYGRSIDEIDKKGKDLESMLEAQLVYVKPSVMKAEQGFASTLPIANDELDAGNNLNTSPLSTTFPFVSSDLSSNKGILYGINRQNSSLVLFDRFEM